MARRKQGNRSHAFTLVEIMIAMAVVLTLLIYAISTLTGLREKRQLVGAANALVDVFTRAQKEANAQRRVMGVCFKSGGGSTYAQAYYPALSAAGLPTDLDCVTGDVLKPLAIFGPSISVCPTCDPNVGLNKSVFFSPIGFPILQNGNLGTYQVCLINPHMGAGSRAREVEVTGGGMIQISKLGFAGDLPSVQANSGTCQ